MVCIRCGIFFRGYGEITQICSECVEKENRREKMNKEQEERLSKFQRIFNKLEKYDIYHDIGASVDGITVPLIKQIAFPSYEETKRIRINLMTWQEFPEEEIIQMVLRSFNE
jgi:DNA-binding protein H-NS